MNDQKKKKNQYLKQKQTLFPFVRMSGGLYADLNTDVVPLPLNAQRPSEGMKRRATK